MFEVSAVILGLKVRLGNFFLLKLVILNSLYKEVTMANKVVLILGFLSAVSVIYACNEAICASVVSKCMLTQSCKCDLKDCSCCKDCFSCLGYLYSECCSCVGKCNCKNATCVNL